VENADEAVGELAKCCWWPMFALERHEGRIAGANDNVVSALRATLGIPARGRHLEDFPPSCRPDLSERTAETLVQD
jgi:hypothetical protein